MPRGRSVPPLNPPAGALINVKGRNAGGEPGVAVPGRRPWSPGSARRDPAALWGLWWRPLNLWGRPAVLEETTLNVESVLLAGASRMV
jgi:hypothetical protein